MKCPLCSTPAEDAALECPSCGAIFAKLRRKQERELRAAEAVVDAPAPSAPSESTVWKLRVAAAAVVFAWMLGLGLYYRSWIARAPGRSSPGAGALPDSLLVRDPDTGELRRVPVKRASPSYRASPAAVQRQPEPLRPSDAPPRDSDFDD